eukprot:TRINITY_DN1028_c0_g1_i4.p2 TRINITY_DN1028_c0_g1~~TRINITY_DN1028_c0_g1_i4.p2  ORF type:complete len:159 (-),score=11.37 TRINITY_DN1028_c0_g1_i4:416-892(-)
MRLHIPHACTPPQPSPLPTHTGRANASPPADASAPPPRHQLLLVLLFLLTRLGADVSSGWRRRRRRRWRRHKAMRGQAQRRVDGRLLQVQLATRLAAGKSGQQRLLLLIHVHAHNKEQDTGEAKRSMEKRHEIHSLLHDAAKKNEPTKKDDDDTLHSH